MDPMEGNLLEERIDDQGTKLNTGETEELMTSLIELCRTEEQKKIAQSLTEIGIVTEGDLLLADEATLKRCPVSQSVSDQCDIANNLGACRISSRCCLFKYTSSKRRHTARLDCGSSEGTHWLRQTG
jgi:hypothetical protein